MSLPSTSHEYKNPASPTPLSSPVPSPHGHYIPIYYLGFPPKATQTHPSHITLPATMSVPLDAIATYDTDERIKRVEQWQEYHRVAREELDRVLARQQVPASPSAGTLPATPKSRLRSASNGWTGTPTAHRANRAGMQVFTPPASPLRAAPEGAPASEVGAETPTKTETKTPGKVSTRIKEIFTPKKKVSWSFILFPAFVASPCSLSPFSSFTVHRTSSLINIFHQVPTSHDTTDGYNDIQSIMGVQRLEPAPAPARPRAANPKDGGQGPGEDNWLWCTRDLYENRPLPPLPPLPPVGPMPGVRNGVGAVAR